MRRSPIAVLHYGVSSFKLQSVLQLGYISDGLSLVVVFWSPCGHSTALRHKVGIHTFVFHLDSSITLHIF